MGMGMYEDGAPVRQGPDPSTLDCYRCDKRKHMCRLWEDPAWTPTTNGSHYSSPADFSWPEGRKLGGAPDRHVCQVACLRGKALVDCGASWSLMSVETWEDLDENSGGNTWLYNVHTGIDLRSLSKTIIPTLGMVKKINVFCGWLWWSWVHWLIRQCHVSYFCWRAGGWSPRWRSLTTLTFHFFHGCSK